MKNLYLLAFAILASVATIAQTNMYTVSPYQDSIWTMDTTNFTAISGVGLTSTSGTVTGCNGLSTRPCTGDIYVAYKVSGAIGRFLGIVDPATGVITEVGNMGDNVAGIAFGSANHLYAVTGDGATVSESLFKVNIATGAMTLFTAYGAGSDGESIAFCPDNGRIYHWSGRDTNPAMESTDTLTGATSTITRTGFNYDEVFGAEYVGDGWFLLANLDQEFILVDTAGFAQNPTFSTAPNYFKGLTFPQAPTPVSAGFTHVSFNLNTQFTNTSANADTWMWDFGDGTTSTVENPGKSYIAPGSYVVCLTATGPCGTDTHCDTVTVTCPIPVAGWSYTNNFFTANFTDASTATVFSRIWDFGDGNTSTQLNPTHVYSTAGTYTVCLTVTDSCGTDSTCGPVNIAGCPPIAADWSSSASNLNVGFTDQSTGTVYFHSWDFGDGNTSFQQNPSHTYSAPGTYTVCLIVADSCSADTFCNSISVTCPTPVSDWSSTSNGFTASFTDNSSASVFSRLWDFGDGNTSTQTNPVHTYSALGTYTVCLTVTDSCGSDSSCGTVIIDCPPIAADWSATTTDLTADFTDLSTGTLYFYAWDFGDGTSDFSQNPTHTYTAAGAYTVCLIVADSCSADTLCNTVTVTDPVGPVNDSICNAIPLVFGPNGPFSVANAGTQAGEPVPPVGSGLNFCQSQDGWCGFENGIDLNPQVDNSVWFTFVAPPSGNVTVNTDNSYDTQIAVYSSTSCDSILAGSYTLEGANDDNPNAFTLFSSEVTVTCLTPGGTYWLQVDGYDGEEGPLNILLTDNLYSAQAMITSTTDTICPGDPSTLTASAGAGFGYSWSPTGDTTQSITVTSGGLYEVMVTDTNGCVAIGTRSIFELNVPNVGLNPSGSTVYCAGDSVLLSASGGGQSQWYLNGVPIAGATTNTYWASAEGIYNMTKTNQNGCSDSAAVGVTVLEDPCLVGLNSATFANDLSVYPSPVSNTLTVSFISANEKAVRLTLFAQDGRMVYSNNPSVGQGRVTLNVDMTEYASGIYLMQIQQGTDQITRRVLKN